MTPKRIFWLGADNVLNGIEVCQLREMGFEVFNPARATLINNVSAGLMIDGKLQTTLARDILAKLMATDFFGRRLTPEIADLVESHFDAVVIAGNPAWLRGFVESFRRPIIFRTYGIAQNLSEYLINAGLWERLVGRDNFTVIPFCPESIEEESRWFHDLCQDYVPYRLADDVYSHSGLWSRVKKHDPVIATSIPDLEDPLHRTAYETFNMEYPHKVFRIYGSQQRHHPDARVLGNIERQTFLRSLAQSSGFFHPHREWAGDLSPIEMMELGGPVLYAPGSLLARLLPRNTPGLIDNRVSSERKLRYLLNDDAHFISDVISCQEAVRQRFERIRVRPVFEEVFSRLLGNMPQRTMLAETEKSDSPSHLSAPIDIGGHRKPASTRTIALFMHADGLNSFFGGGCHLLEGVRPMVDAVLRTTNRTTDFHLLVSCLSSQKSDVYDRFAAEIHSGRMELHVIEAEDGIGSEFIEELARLSFIERLNSREDVCLAIIPHPTLFPESLLLEHPVSLYLPDYLPLLLANVTSGRSDGQEAETANVARALIGRASTIFTAREAGAGPLVAAGVIEAAAVDRFIALPLRPVSCEQAALRDSNRENRMEDRIAGRRFLFYPAANRPGGNIAFFLKSFASLRQMHPDLLAVLTEPLAANSPARAIADTFSLHPHLEIVHQASDADIAWLNRNAAVVCMTSTRENGFPAPLRDALTYGAPAIVMRLPEITEILGDEGEHLLLCAPLDMADFSEKVEFALEQRDRVLQGQSRVLALLNERGATDIFAQRLNQMLGIALGNAVDRDKACV
ncbi:glycosyltransferase [Rhizobium sp. FY34]|uniref:glycosyltransferase n=1 Tax=Rhizobium sp. FY34 TaxID=2562309 RepID=UPI0010BFEA12|nr:glycosyltransferase [Rhizobium sp. FY34]